MASPTNARQLAEKIARLEAAVADLQRSSQLSHSSIEGSLVAHDDDGNVVVVVGEQDDGTWGVSALNGATIYANAVEPGSITEVEIADDSISTPKLRAGAVGADQLAANIVLASTIVGGDPAGARVELSATGLAAFSPAGIQTLDFNSATGELTIIGQFQSDEGTKSRVEIGQATSAFYTSIQVIEFEVGDDIPSTSPGQIIHGSADQVTAGVSDTMAMFVKTGYFADYAEALIELNSGNSQAPSKMLLQAESIFTSGACIFDQTEFWHYVGAAGEPAYQNGYGVSNIDEQLRFRKDVAGNAHIQGRAVKGTDDAVVFTLPVGYRPSQRLRFNTLSNGSFDTVAVTIETDGTVSANWDTGAGTEINLTLPPFYVLD